MRRILTLMILLVFSLQSFAGKLKESSFTVTADLADSVLTTLDENKNTIHLKLPKDTSGVVEQKLPLGDHGAFVYKVRIKSVGTGSASNVQAGQEVWIPYNPKAPVQSFEFTDTRGRVLFEPDTGHSARATRDVELNNIGNSPRSNNANISECPTVLDGQNSSMIKGQIACLEKSQTKGKKSKKSTTVNSKEKFVLPADYSVDPVYLEMLSYIDSVVPKQHELNAEIAYYTLKYAREMGIPIVVMLAMEKAETTFLKNKKCSPMGACGLLQLMPGTAAKWADSKRDANVNRKDIASNAKWAAQEIRAMMDLKVVRKIHVNSRGKVVEEFSTLVGKNAENIPAGSDVFIEKPSLNEMLIAYNGGPGALSVALKRKKPYKETRNYIVEIHKSIDEYNRMFSDNHQSIQSPVID